MRISDLILCKNEKNLNVRKLEKSDEKKLFFFEKIKHFHLFKTLHNKMEQKLSLLAGWPVHFFVSILFKFLNIGHWHGKERKRPELSQCFEHRSQVFVQIYSACCFG